MQYAHGFRRCGLSWYSGGLRPSVSVGTYVCARLANVGGPTGGAPIDYSTDLAEELVAHERVRERRRQQRAAELGERRARLPVAHVLQHLHARMAMA